MGDGDPSDEELVALLARRADLLGTLAGEPLPKRDLVASIDASRSTVDRAVRELEAINAVETGGECSLTLPGRLLLDAYDQFSETARAVLDHRDLLGYLPEDAPLDAAVLYDAEVVVAGPDTMYRPGERVAELVADAERVVGLARAYTQSEAVDLYRRKLHEEGAPVEMVFARDMYERLAADEGVREEILANEHLTAHTVEEVPYGLFLLGSDDGRRVCLLVYDADNVLRGLVVNDSVDALDWGERVFERYRERAEPVEPDG